VCLPTPIIAGHLKGMFDVFKYGRSRSPGIIEEHVESTRLIFQAMARKVSGSQLNELSLFSCRHRVGHASVAIRSASFDFDKNQRLPHPGHNIQFSTTDPNVAIKNPVPFSAKKPFGSGFGFLAQELSGEAHASS
jgi:hypothetical protein